MPCLALFARDPSSTNLLSCLHAHGQRQRRLPQDMTYLLYILQDHMHFGDSDQRIKLVKQINGKEMSWTLGLTVAPARYVPCNDVLL
jgi:hypothetical protein